jgi:hypothetical protein
MDQLVSAKLILTLFATIAIFVSNGRLGGQSGEIRRNSTHNIGYKHIEHRVVLPLSTVPPPSPSSPSPPTSA